MQTSKFQLEEKIIITTINAKTEEIWESVQAKFITKKKKNRRIGNRNNNYTVIEKHTDQKVPLALGSH